MPNQNDPALTDEIIAEEMQELTADNLMSDFDADAFNDALAQLDANDQVAPPP